MPAASNKPATTAVALPINITSFAASRETLAKLTWMTVAPASCAIYGISAAGVTMLEVPVDSRKSHARALVMAIFQARAGKSSLNHTTPGRSRSLHRALRGGSFPTPERVPSAVLAACGMRSIWGLPSYHADAPQVEAPDQWWTLAKGTGCF